MEIKDNKFEFSKSSWVYKLLSWTGMSKWDEPKEACTLAVMLSWRLALAALLVINFFWGWGYVLFGSPAAGDHQGMIAVVILAWVETLFIALFGIVQFAEYVGKRFDKCKQTCPRVRWIEEWEENDG